MQNDVYFDYNPWWEGAFQLENVVERPMVLENQVEIDFYLDNQVLIEVKLEEDIKDKQKEFFEKFKARHKRVIRGFEDLAQLETLLAGFLEK